MTLKRAAQKITEAIALKLCVPFGWNTRWLLEGKGDRMMDKQHLDNLKAQIFERGMLSEEEWKMIEWLRQRGIKTLYELRGEVGLAEEMTTVLRERLQGYKTQKKTK